MARAGVDHQPIFIPRHHREVKLHHEEGLRIVADFFHRVVGNLTQPELRQRFAAGSSEAILHTLDYPLPNSHSTFGQLLENLDATLHPDFGKRLQGTRGDFNAKEVSFTVESPDPQFGSWGLSFIAHGLLGSTNDSKIPITFRQIEIAAIRPRTGDAPEFGPRIVVDIQRRSTDKDFIREISIN